jgi:hypothetical protein
MDDFVPILIVGFLVLGTYKLFELFVRKNERLAIIEKLFTLSESKEISGTIKLPNISLGNTNNGSWALRISLLLIGIGVGCLLAFITQYGLFDSFVDYQNKEITREARHQIYNIQSIINFSFIAIFGGAGLLIAYLIESKQAKNK